MASKLGDFLLNKSSKDEQVVDAPAFSLTKVLASAAVIITPIATLLVEQLKNVDLTSGNYVALATAVLGFLAIASAADVLGRSYASGAARHAEAMEKVADKNVEVAHAGAESAEKVADKNVEAAQAGMAQIVIF